MTISLRSGLVHSHLVEHALIALTILAAARSSAATELRVWTDSTGRHKFEARLVGIEADQAVLESPSGKTVRVAVYRLSESDRRFVLSQPTTGTVPKAGETLQQIESYADLIAAASKLRFAANVLTLYESFLKRPGVSETDRAAALAELTQWQQLAKDKSVRYGGEWSSPDEIQKKQKEARELIKQSLTQIEVGNEDLARQYLLRASKADREGVHADFILGMLHAVVGGHPDPARKHFLVCVRRLQDIGPHRTPLQTANLIAAMNNLAIAEVRLKQAPSALRRWSEAMNLGETPPEIAQNLGRFAALASADAFVRVTPTLANAISAAYSKVATSDGARQYERSTGWLYVPYLAAEEVEQERPPQAVKPASGRPTAPGTQDLRVFGSGTGFAIGSGYVLTNRHVVEDATAYRLHSEAHDLPGQLGELVAVSDTHDLALLRFTELKAPSMKLSGRPPRLSTEVRVLGFPRTELLGTTLKATAGSISGLPSQKGGIHGELAEMLLLDAIANPGNSGGPVIDRTGAVVGVMTLCILSEQQYTAAVPAAIAQAFIADHVPEVDPANESQESGSKEWEDVVEAAAASTFQVVAMGRVNRPAWANERPNEGDAERPVRPNQWNGLEDPWCMFCNGLSHLECTNRQCKSGTIISREVVWTTLPDGKKASRTVSVRDRCPTCSGRGRVSCPFCSNGFDPSIRN